MSEMAASNDVWEIRKGKVVWVSSPMERCGYDDAALAALKKAGYRLYCNGKEVPIRAKT